MALIFAAWCSDAQRVKMPKLEDPVLRFQLGIKELEAALSLPPNPAELQPQAIDFSIAYGQVSLARAYTDKKQFALAASTMSNAAEVYKRIEAKTLADAYPHITSPDTERHRRQDALIEVAVGLIRCGQPIRALAVLENVSEQNPERTYLRAEVLFSLGDRPHAGEIYEQWIRSGCDYRYRMITSGTDWTFLGRLIKGKLPSYCEMLPKELRARLDELHEQFGHPNNLPLRNHALTGYHEITTH